SKGPGGVAASRAQHLSTAGVRYLLQLAVDRGLDDDRPAQSQDRAGHLGRSPLDEVRGDRRGAGGDVTRVAVEVEFDLVAGRLLSRRGRGIGARGHHRLIRTRREIVAVDRYL